MRAFSVICKTKEEGYSFARLAMRLGIKWRDDTIFTPNTNRWERYGDKTHYNVSVFVHEVGITYGMLERDIRYDVLPSNKFDLVNSWSDVEHLIEELW